MSAAPGPTDPSSFSHGFVNGVASDVITTGRLESFSDGVMAVIITVMAFNLRPPSADTVAAVEHRLPTLLIYMLSFTVIGIYWNNHHHLLRLTTAISGSVMWANLGLLFWLSLVPVVTQWVGQDYKHAVPAIAYGIVSLGSALTYFLLVRTILRANHDDAALSRALGHDVKGTLSPLVSLSGIALAPVSPYLSYGCFALLSLMWIIPDRRLVRQHVH